MTVNILPLVVLRYWPLALERYPFSYFRFSILTMDHSSASQCATDWGQSSLCLHGSVVSGFSSVHSWSSKAICSSSPWLLTHRTVRWWTPLPPGPLLRQVREHLCQGPIHHLKRKQNDVLVADSLWPWVYTQTMYIDVVPLPMVYWWRCGCIHHPMDMLRRYTKILIRS